MHIEEVSTCTLVIWYR